MTTPAHKRQGPIAIVGIGGVFPQAPTLTHFWNNIRAGVDAASVPPPGRWLLPLDDAYAAGVAVPDKVNSRRACFIEDFAFDAAGLRLDAGSLAGLDPMYLLLLHAGRQAWENARQTQANAERAGVVVGNIALPTDGASALARRILGRTFVEQIEDRLECRGQLDDPLAVDLRNRYVAGLPGGLLARALGLGGGSYTLDAACASSLYAVKLAADALNARRADVMLAGGLSRPDCLYTQMGFSQLRAVSPRGRCAPFDASADGLVVGEGCGIVVLKRLEDAIAAGDHIYAVIAGIGLSNDRHGRLLAPSSEGQLRAMRSAYARAGWQPSDIDLIECHATGTPVGDAVELGSLAELWGQAGWKPGQCVLGSVKSNVGHTLTAAGSAGLLKVLLALKHETLPASANFETPAGRLADESLPFRVLPRSEDWPAPREGAPRRAAVSAFGFGGINAHLLLEEWRPSTKSVAVPALPPPPTVAIVGIGVRLGPWNSRHAFTRRAFGIDDGVRPEPPRRWWGVEQSRWFKAEGRNAPPGFYLDQIAVPARQFRIPPRELEEMLPQQLLMLLAADEALADCRWNEDLLLSTGAFIGIGLDLNTTNFQLRWWLLEKARHWNRQLELGLEEAELADWVDRLREAAGPALSANRTMGALGGIVASRVAREFRIGGPSFTLSSEETSGLRAVETAVRLLQQGDIDQALVGAVDLAGDVRAVLAAEELVTPADGAVAFVLRREEDAVRAGERIYARIRGIGAGSLIQQAAERAQVEAGVSATVPLSIASSDDVFGDAGAARGLVALARAALGLHHEIVPGALEQARAPQYWLRNRAEGPRRAAISDHSVDGNHLHIILEQADAVREAESRSIVEPAEGLFVLEADDSDGLHVRLRELGSFARESSRQLIFDVAHAWHRQHPVDARRRLGLALIARRADELAVLTELAAGFLATGSNPDPERIFHNPTATGGPVAFVFPGSGNHFAGMGRDVALCWPEAIRRQDQANGHLRRQLVPERFWETQASTPQVVSRREQILGQVALGTLVSDVVRGFGVQPAGVVGYSLGETAGLFALGAWRARDEMLERMHASELFNSELAGPCHAARKHWQLPARDEVNWRAGVVAASAERVRALLPGYQRVYLLIVNTPDEAVIGGQRSEVDRLVAELGCRFVPLDGVSTVHCPIAAEVADAYRDLHRLPTHDVPGVRFYSGAWARAYELSSEKAAESITAQALHGLDFPALVEKAYADGQRVFLEMGPGSSCTRMIGRILRGRPHLARSACVPGQESRSTILRVLASLVAERVPVHLDPLYKRHESAPAEPADEPMIVVPVGGAPFDVPAPPRKKPTAAPPAPSAQLPQEPTPAPALAPQVPMEAFPSIDSENPLNALLEVNATRAQAHAAFLRFAGNLTETYSQQLAVQMSLLELGTPPAELVAPTRDNGVDSNVQTTPAPAEPVFLNREQCLEFARGSIARVLGAAFAEVDSFPTRVRLPDEPLMLVDRILSVEGEPGSLGTGRVVTAHDILPGNWYLDNGVIPTCIAVESGQADLFLSGYLGIDARTRGLACYRLLDALVTFHRGLPGPGAVILYDIHIDGFFRQGETYLFRFRFEGTVDGEPLLTMRDGCAGFFTAAELAAGKGIVQTGLDRQPRPGKRPDDWRELVPMQTEAFGEAQLDRLRAGDLAGCFGPLFDNLPVERPLTLPGGLMKLVDRISLLDPTGGRFGLGLIRGEADIHPDDWFLTCHFVDDRVMPGTLMYECCLHTLRVFLLRMGWVGSADDVVCEPVPGVASRLKCRGQVIESTRLATYEIVLKEIGYRPEPYVLCDALMYADGKPIVEITDMSLRLSGLSRSRIEGVWDAERGRRGDAEKQTISPSPLPPISASRSDSPLPPVSASRSDSPLPPISPSRSARPALYDRERITAFAIGKPSEAFGAPYRVFDDERVIARLPGPPYQFLDRIVRIEAEPWQVQAGGVIEAEYDVPPEEWYFAAERQGTMPFAVLLEVALQPCGWLAAFMGSALTSPIDMSFRNLGGAAIQHARVGPDCGALTTTVHVTKVAGSGGMLIQHYNFSVHDERQLVYEGNTYFGFFTKAALAQQVGVREAAWFKPPAGGRAFAFPENSPYPDRMLRMVDRVDCLQPAGGPHGLGYIAGTMDVNPAEWFFKAHFHQDPVCPGSLGLEALYQLLKVFAVERWGDNISFENPITGLEHRWVYRGQVIPSNRQVAVQALITSVDDATRIVKAEGLLAVDGLIIYQMNDFTLKAC